MHVFAIEANCKGGIAKVKRGNCKWTITQLKIDNL